MTLIKQAPALSQLFFSKNILEKKELLTFLTKQTFVKISFLPFVNGKVQNDIFGKCVAIKKKHHNASITLIYAVNKYKILITIPLYNSFIKNITVYKKI
jgi:hypothetical protein